jgi:hypothetical protein
MTQLKITQPTLNKARQDSFRLILTIPNILKTINSSNIRENKLLSLDKLQFSVYNINLPDISIPEIALQAFGQNYNVTSYNRPAYTAVTVDFEVDNEYNNYWTMWKWMTLFNGVNTGLYGDKDLFPKGYPKLEPKIQYDYTTSIFLELLDEYRNPKIEFTYKYAFPTKLGGLTFNYRDTNQVKSSFTFVFNQLEAKLFE